MTLLEEVYETTNVVSMDLVEVNPLLGDPQAVKRTSLITKHLLGSAFGYNRGGLAKPF
jgi:arginase family enzyme